MVLIGLSLFSESRAIRMPGSSDVALDAEGKVRLFLLNEALSGSKLKGKSTYTSWVTYFTQGTGAESDVVLEAMFVFWLSWYVLPSRPEDGINPYVFPLAIRLAKG